MKRLILFIVLFIGFGTVAEAQQKVCYIYSQKVLESMPEYKEAVNTLNNMSKAAREKSDALFEEAKNMFNEFQEYQERMSQSQYNRYKQMVIDKEKEANDYEERMFGEDGEIAKKQKELMEPIEKKLLAVVNAFAERGKYDMIYDLSIVKLTIYQRATLDMTNRIIEEVKNYKTNKI